MTLTMQTIERKEEHELIIETSIASLLLKEGIHVLTQMNETRLYWLWMRYLITAGAKDNLTVFTPMLPVIETMMPAITVLSWGLFGSRLLLQCLSFIQQSCDTTPLTMQQVLSDCLWGASNFISAQWLHGSTSRMGTKEWWGHACMQILLINDLLLVAYQFKHETNQHKKNLLFKKLTYTFTLACGYFLLRGFYAPISSVIPHYIGGIICVSATTLFNAFDWQYTIQHGQNQEISKPVCSKTIGAAASLGLELCLPLFITLSPSNTNKLLVVTLALIAHASINVFFKHDNFLYLSSCSLFSYRKNPLTIIAPAPPVHSLV